MNGTLGTIGLVAVGAMVMFGHEQVAGGGQDLLPPHVEQSCASQDKLMRAVENLQHDYYVADENAKAAIRADALGRLATVPSDCLTANLRAFTIQLRSDTP